MVAEAGVENPSEPVKISLPSPSASMLLRLLIIKPLLPTSQYHLLRSRERLEAKCDLSFQEGLA